MYMPFEIQVQIIERLPLKSVIKCRSVSKSLKSWIDSSEFIASYSVRHTQPERLLIRYRDPLYYKENYVSFVDDSTFPEQKFVPTVPLIVEQFNPSIIVGNCQGLFCLYGYPNSGMEIAVLWNPSIRKVVVVAIPNLFEGKSRNVLGFGVCPGTSDPKIIRICDRIDGTTCISRKFEVFALSTGTWASLSSNLPCKSIKFTMYDVVVLDRFIYWSASDTFLRNKLIISFDLTNSEFGEVYLPDSLALNSFSTLSISKLRDSLAVIENDPHFRKKSHDVWMMEDGVPKSFIKLFSIKAPDVRIHKTLGFRNTGDPILEVQSDNLVTPAVYLPYLEQLNKIQIDGIYYSFFVQSYTETLLLLDQPEFSSY